MTSPYWRQTGAVWPMGVPTSLTWYDLGALLTLIHTFQVRLVIEIGVEHGGASAVLASRARYTQTHYRGIDITLHELDDDVRAYDGERIHQRDAWKDATVQEVAQWLREVDGPALIFVDGGDKPKEMHLYAPLLRPGDVMAAHDYGNEYTEDALKGMPTHLERLAADWLDDTLLCAWRAT